MKKTFLMSALFMILNFSVANAEADWVWIYSNDQYSIWVDNNSISRGGKYLDYDFKAVIKKTYNDYGKEKTIELFVASAKNNGLPISYLPKEIYKLSYVISQEYFKSVNGIKYISTIDGTYYTDDNQEISAISYHYDKLNWHQLKPDTIGEETYDAVYARVSGK